MPPKPKVSKACGKVKKKKIGTNITREVLNLFHSSTHFYLSPKMPPKAANAHRKVGKKTVEKNEREKIKMYFITVSPGVTVAAATLDELAKACGHNVTFSDISKSCNGKTASRLGSIKVQAQFVISSACPRYSLKCAGLAAAGSCMRRRRD